MIEHTVLLIDLPPHIHSFITRKDGFITVVINARLSQGEQQKAYSHELKHLSNDDLSAVLPVDWLEKIRHE